MFKRSDFTSEGGKTDKEINLRDRGEKAKIYSKCFHSSMWGEDGKRVSKPKNTKDYRVERKTA